MYSKFVVQIKIRKHKFRRYWIESKTLNKKLKIVNVEGQYISSTRENNDNQKAQLYRKSILLIPNNVKCCWILNRGLESKKVDSLSVSL